MNRIARSLTAQKKRGTLERNLAVVEACVKGDKSYNDIGKFYRITKVRVKQIYDRYLAQQIKLKGE